MRLFLLSVFLFLSSCSKPEPLYNTQSYVFGTLVDITIYGETETKAKAIANEISLNFQRLHHRLHAWQASELNTLNDAISKAKSPIDVKPDLAAMISETSQLSTQSDGAFNPAIGQLIALWGFHHDEFKPVNIDPDKIASLVAANPQMRDIIVNDNKVFTTNPNVKLDLGGYAKGYALDLALETLKAKGVKHALINIGGNIIALGKHGSHAWRVGIQHPRKPNAIAMLDLESGWAIGTTGDYQRYFELDGKRYCHIINPATGYPVQNIQAVTVLIPPQIKSAGVLSDVASKPIFIAEPNMRQNAAKAMGVENYLIIESANKILLSPSMAKRITWLDKDAEKHATQTTP